MNNKLNSILSKSLLLAFPLLLTFCGDDESAPKSNFSYKIDGVSQDVQTVAGQMAFSVEYDHEGRSLNLTAAKGFTQMLSIAVSNWDFQNPPAEGVLTGEYDASFDMENTDTDNPLSDCLELTGENAGVMLCDGALVTLIKNDNVWFSAYDGAADATVTITKCANHTVSGTFSAKVADFDGADEQMITGSFSNVKYSVID